MRQAPGLSTVMGEAYRNGYALPIDGRRLLVGVRTPAVTGDAFDDWLGLLYQQDGSWVYSMFPGTTDPGTYYLNNPLNVKGTAIMKAGYYRGAYEIGRHRNYRAFRQCAPITVYRDNNGNGILDTLGMEEETGVFWTNMHHASAYRDSDRVGRWSAGCQVLQSATHLRFMLDICAAEAMQKYFDYMLLEEKTFRK